MLRKRFTFIIIPPNDGQVREYRFPFVVLWALAGCLSIFVCCCGYFTFGYYLRVDQAFAIGALKSENKELTRSVEKLGKSLAEIEEDMSVLAEDDERLRYLHQMEILDIPGGVGGPEELPSEEIAMAFLPEHKRTTLTGLRIKLERLQSQVRWQKESFRQIEQAFHDSAKGRNYVPTIAPVDRNKGWVSSLFGPRTDPFTGKKANHLGIDVAGRTGTPVMVTADGIVVHAYADRRLGRVVIVDHDIEGVDENGEHFVQKGIYRTIYGHLSKSLVKKGQRVTRGQLIGQMGTSGRSTGPHLHYAVRYQDPGRGPYKGYLNPLEFMLDMPVRNDEVSGWETQIDE